MQLCCVPSVRQGVGEDIVRPQWGSVWRGLKGIVCATLAGLGFGLAVGPF